MAFSKLTNGSKWALSNQAASYIYKRSLPIGYFVIHHAAIANDSGLKSQYVDSRRFLSSTYAMTRDGGVHGVLDENCIPATTNHSIDSQAVTIEIANQSTGGDWPISNTQMHSLARLIADVATRHGFPITRDRIRMHSDYQATACPGPWIQSRIHEIIALAKQYAANGGTSQETTPIWKKDEEDMFLIHVDGTQGPFQLIHLGTLLPVQTFPAGDKSVNKVATRFGNSIPLTKGEYDYYVSGKAAARLK